MFLKSLLLVTINFIYSDGNTSMTRNPNPIWIQDNDESPSTTKNPSLTRIQYVDRNPNPTRIQDVMRNPYPIRIEDPLTYNESPITWTRAKKMKEALHLFQSQDEAQTCVI